MGPSGRWIVLAALLAIIALGALATASVVRNWPPDHKGDLGEDCNADGTCNGVGLECAWHNKCHVKGPPQVVRSCGSDAECFCAACLQTCEGKVHICAYSDVSVWGAKPSTCECVGLD